MPLPPRDFTQIGPNEGEILATLGATPGGIGDLARGLSGAQVARRREEGEWCFTEILDPLLAGERDTILPRLRGMRDEDEPVFASSAASRAARGDPRELDFGALLAEFGRVRAETVALLRGLDDAGWQRRGTSPSRGPLTIEQYARSIAERIALDAMPSAARSTGSNSLSRARGIDGPWRLDGSAVVARQLPRHGSACATGVCWPANPAFTDPNGRAILIADEGGGQKVGKVASGFERGADTRGDPHACPRARDAGRRR